MTGWRPKRIRCVKGCGLVSAFQKGGMVIGYDAEVNPYDQEGELDD